MLALLEILSQLSQLCFKSVTGVENERGSEPVLKIMHTSRLTDSKQVGNSCREREAARESFESLDL